MLSKVMTTKVLEQVLNLLASVEAKYKIVLPDGAEYGELLIAPPAPPPPVRKKKVFVNPPGTLLKFYKSYLEGMQVGNVATVPVHDSFKASAMQSAMTAYACNNWGAGSAMSHYDKEKNTIELMRVK